ncbi:MAG: MFS transporter [Bacillota bacterium]
MEGNPLLLVSWVIFFVNIAVQGSMIFIPLLSARMGASNFQIGLIGAAYGAAYLLFSLYSGRRSDRRGRLGFVRVGLLLCTFAFAAQLLAHQLITLALVRAGVGMALGVTMAALVAYAFESGSDMGKFSSYGSLGWIFGALSAAWLTDVTWLFAVSSLCCGAAFILSLRLPAQAEKQKAGEQVKPSSYITIIRRGFPVYLAVFLRHLGAAAVWIILPLYFISLGMDKTWVGILWGVNFAVQFVVMRYLERFNPHRVFALGQIVSIAVFVAFALVRNPWLFILVEAALGVAWSCLYVGGLLLVLRAGEDRGTASGIFQSTLSLCGAVGPFLGGMIAQGWGYQGVMYFAAALGVAGMMVAIPQAKEPAGQQTLG